MSSPRPRLRLVTTAAQDDDRRDPAEGGHDEDVEGDSGPITLAPDDASTPSRTLATPRQQRIAVSALIVVQALGALAYAGRYVTLAREGSVSPAAAILGAPALLCLYLGALLLALRPGHGRPLFFVAAIGLGLSVPFWGIDYAWTWPVAFGAVLGLAGAWVARAEVVIAEDMEAQP